MKSIGTLALIVALFGWGTVANATIIDAHAWDDGDGAMDCTGAIWNGVTNTEQIGGCLHWGPGHIGNLNEDGTVGNDAYFTTDESGDPIVTRGEHHRKRHVLRLDGLPRQHLHEQAV